MIKTLPISLCAGLASALLIGSLTSNPVVAVILFCFSPMPLFLTGLGWGHKAVGIAAIAGLGALFFIAAPQVSIFYFGAIALPTTILTYFTLMSRQSDNPAAKDNIEWYPLGRVIVIAAILAGGLAVMMLVFVGGDLNALYKMFKKGISVLYSGNSSFNELKNTDPEKAEAFLDFFVKSAPAASSGLWFLILLANLYVAQKFLGLIGRAIRSEWGLMSIIYPQTYLIFFAASLALTFVGGLPGYFAGVFAAVGIVAYAILGFAVLHKITAGHTFQPLMLGLAYLMVLIFNWFALIVIMGIGLFETFFGLREKFGKKNGS